MISKIVRSFFPSLFYTLFLLFFLGACTQGTKQKAIVMEPKEAQIEPSSKYSDYLLLMTEDQRFRFFQCEDDGAKERFLQREGLLYAQYLDEHLKSGLPSEKVVEILGEPVAQEIDMDLSRKETCWIYAHFNGYRVVRYSLLFHNDRLTSWSTLDF